MFGRRARAGRRQQAEADRLFAEADRLAEQIEESPNYRREIAADRAARITHALGDLLARDARAQAGEPTLQGADLDAELDQLAQQYPEPGNPADAALPDYKVLCEEEYSQRFGHLSGREEAEAIDRLVEAGEIELGPYGPIVTDLDREQTEMWLAEDRYAEFAAANMTPEEIAEEVHGPGEEPGEDAARWVPPEGDASEQGLTATQDFVSVPEPRPYDLGLTADPHLSWEEIGIGMPSPCDIGLAGDPDLRWADIEAEPEAGA